MSTNCTKIVRLIREIRVINVPFSLHSPKLLWAVDLVPPLETHNHVVPNCCYRSECDAFCSPGHLLLLRQLSLLTTVAALWQTPVHAVTYRVYSLKSHDPSSMKFTARCICKVSFVHLQMCRYIIKYEKHLYFIVKTYFNEIWQRSDFFLMC